MSEAPVTINIRVMVPEWTKRDLENLQRRIQRMAPKEKIVTCTQGCRDNDHSHAQKPVGPYQICRCLQCPVLVVGYGG